MKKALHIASTELGNGLNWLITSQLSTRWTALLLMAVLSQSVMASALQVDLSPLNQRRPKVDSKQIKHIILHTTEGAYPGCFLKLKQKGEAHYLVRATGQVIQLMDLNRLAKHAGRSLWNDKRAIDLFSIGIEVEGTHTIPPNLAQRASLRALLSQLRRQFRIPARDVLTHSMVAYGTPNRFWHQDHRGRKRCGMMMQREDIRSDLGLDERSQMDPNVMAEQLVIADEPLFAFLFNPHTTGEVFSETASANIRRFVLDLGPPPSALATRIPMPKPENIKPNTPPTKRDSAEDIKQIENEIEFLDADSVNGDATQLVGAQASSERTIYFFKTGTIRTGKELEKSKFPADPKSLPKGTKILAGYIYGGKVSLGRSAYSITKKLWNFPSTIYRWPDATIRTGDEVDPSSIPVGTIILFQR